MKPFNAKPFDQRFAEMGDEAESVYEAVAPLGNTIRFGWRRPKGINFKKLSSALRHMPDYFAQAGYFVEVMGLGRDGMLKSLKTDKWDALKLWKRIANILGLADLMLFVWNSHEKEYVIIPWETTVKLVARSKKAYGIQKFESDGNEYYQLDWAWLKETAAWVGSWEPSNT